MVDVMIAGEAGNLHAVYHKSEQEAAPLAVILSGSPRQKCHMNDRVSYAMFRAFMDIGFSVVRFNYRGVDRSQGSIRTTADNMLDIATVIDWIQNKNEDSDKIHAKVKKDETIDSHFQFKIHKNDKLGIYSNYITILDQNRTEITGNEKIYWNGQIKTSEIIDDYSLFNVYIDSKNNDNDITYLDDNTNKIIKIDDINITYNDNGSITSTNDFIKCELTKKDTETETLTLQLTLNDGSKFYEEPTSYENIDQPSNVTTKNISIYINDYNQLFLDNDNITVSDLKISNSKTYTFIGSNIVDNTVNSVNLKIDNIPEIESIITYYTNIDNEDITYKSCCNL